MPEWELTRTYRSAAGEVRWDRLGDSGDPVVLCHGTPFSSYVWRRIARALSASHRVYVWDMPGYGASAKFDGQDVSLGVQSTVFAELLAHWGLDRPTVVAHDFGGTVSLRALLLHERPYARLALLNPVALAPWGSPFFRHVRAHSDAFAGLPDNLHRALAREYISSVSKRGLHPDVLERLVQPWTGPDGQPALYRQMAQADHRYTDEFYDQLEQIDIPVLVGWGEDDAWLPVAQAHKLAALIPGAELRLFADAGHLVQEEAPAELTGALLDFLRR